jgi:hypothetical protein
MAVLERLCLLYDDCVYAIYSTSQSILLHGICNPDDRSNPKLLTAYHAASLAPGIECSAMSHI